MLSTIQKPVPQNNTEKAEKGTGEAVSRRDKFQVDHKDSPGRTRDLRLKDHRKPADWRRAVLRARIRPVCFDKHLRKLIVVAVVKPHQHVRDVARYLNASQLERRSEERRVGKECRY